MNITLLKLGGSLITDKSKPYTARLDVIKRIASEIRSALSESPGINLILGNGAGSFAHQSAAKFKTHEGFSTDEGRLGACIVHQDAMKLHMIVLEELLNEGVPAFSFSPSSFIVNNITIQQFNNLAIQQSLKQGLIPFIYGDVILDKKRGSTIYSSDKTLSILATELSGTYQISRIIHAGDYDGVYDSDKNSIEKITKDTFPALEKHFSDSENVDVTGGMKKKIEETMKLAEKGINSIIINGSTPGNIKKALLDQHVKGTLITQK